MSTLTINQVKCDEARPSCRNCTLRRETCVYPAPQPASPPTPRSASSGPRSPTETQLEVSRRRDLPLVIHEPQFILSGRTATEMQLIWHYTTSTYISLSTWSFDDTRIINLLRVKLLEYAASSPFLMDGLLALSAMHQHYLGERSAPSKALVSLYRARAFEGYRKAITSLDPASFPALLVSSIVLCGLSSDMFHGEEAKPLYILDWISVWRGIRLVIQLTRDFVPDSAVVKSNMDTVEPLFYRPPVDLDVAATHIPSNLLFMVANIKPGDPEYAFVDAYYLALKYLGTLYQELTEVGPGPTLNLRVITFFTHLPDEFVDRVGERRKRAAVIIAHYLVFLKGLRTVWWMRDISDREIVNIANLLGAGWEDLMRVPLAAVKLSHPMELAQLLLDNYDRESPVGGARVVEEDMITLMGGIEGFVYRRPENVLREC